MRDFVQDQLGNWCHNVPASGMEACAAEFFASGGLGVFKRTTPWGSVGLVQPLKHQPWVVMILVSLPKQHFFGLVKWLTWLPGWAGQCWRLDAVCVLGRFLMCL